jgi:hypothetical protein
VDTNILLFANEHNAGKTICAVTNNDKNCLKELSVFIKQHHSFTDFGMVGNNSWIILSDIEQSIKRKVESAGTPLKNWDIKINYGIKTGYNQAFIITTEKRSEILANCQSVDEKKRTEELIRPILRGRDIKRYSYHWANLWLIWIPWHFPLHLDNTIQGASEKAEKEFKKHYTAVYNHLIKFKAQLSARNKAETGIRYEWYALQRWGANYWDLFFQPKICWKAVGRHLAFSIVEPGIYLSAPASFLSAGNNNHYILAFLCSLVGKYFIYTNSDTTGAGDIMLNIQSIIKFPIPIPNENEREIITSLVLETNEKRIEDYISLKFSFTDEEIEYMRERTK